MLAFSGAEITDERWHLKAIFRTSKTQEDVQRRNVYPHDLLTIMVGAGLLIGTIPANTWSHSRDGMCACPAWGNGLEPADLFSNLPENALEVWLSAEIEGCGGLVGKDVLLPGSRV